MGNNIGINIELNGAATFGQQMKNCASALKSFQSQAQNAMAALDKNASAFTKSTTESKALQNVLKGLENEHDTLGNKISQLESNFSSNQQKLEELNKAYQNGEMDEKSYEQQKKSLENEMNGEATRINELKAKYDALEVEITNTKNRLQELGGTLGAVGSQLQEYGSQLQTVGDKISSIGGTLTGTLTTGLAGAAAACVSSYGEVDEQFRLVESTMGSTKNTAEDFDNLWQTMSDDAQNSVYTMSESADALLQFARAGFTANESADLLNPALSLAAGTGTELATVTEGLGSTMKLFGADTSEASNYANIFAQAQAQANTTTTDLFEAISAGGSSVKTVGWDMSDLAAIVDVLGDNMISGSEAGNALKTGLAKLVSPAASGAKAMDDLGLSAGGVNSIFDETTGELKPMTEVMSNLSNAFSDLSGTEQMAAASNIFGKNQMSKWLTLIQNGNGTLQDYRNGLDETSVTADDMANSLLSGVGGSIEKLKSTFDVFKTTVGESVSGTFQPLIDKVTELIGSFNSMDESQRQVIIKVAAAVAAIGPCLLIIGKLTSGVGLLSSGVGTVVSGFGTFFEKITTGSGLMGTLGGAFTSLLSPVTLIVVAIAGLVAIFATLFATNEDFRNSMMEVWSNVQSKIEEVIGAIQPAIQAFVDLANAIWAEWGDEITAVVNTVVDILGTVLVGVFNVITSVLTFLANHTSQISAVIRAIVTVLVAFFQSQYLAWKFIIDTVVSVITTVVSWFKTTWNALSEFFSSTLDALLQFVESIIDAVVQWFTDTWNAVCDFLTETWDAICQLVDTAITLVKTTITTTITAIKTTWTTIWTAVSTFFKTMWNTLVTFVRNLTGKMKEAIDNLLQKAHDTFFEWVDKAWSWGSDLVHNIADGIRGAIDSVIDAVTAVGNAIKEHLHFSEPDVGPLKDFNSWPKDMMSQYIGAIEAARPALQAAVSDVSADVAMMRGNELDADAVYNAVRSGAADATVRLVLNDRELGRALRGMGVSFA